MSNIVSKYASFVGKEVLIDNPGTGYSLSGVVATVEADGSDAVAIMLDYGYGARITTADEDEWSVSRIIDAG